MIPYRESDSAPFYANHFSEQTGGFDVFVGKEVMGGRGFGSVLSGLMRSAAPLLKRGAAALGKRALTTGIGVANDFVRGDNVLRSLKRRAKAEAGDLFGDVLHAIKPDNMKGSRAAPRRSPKRRKRTPRKTVL